MVALRAERARLLGYETFADFKLADTMAKTPGDVLESSRTSLGAGASPGPAASATTCRRWRRRDGDNIAIEPWDWRYYAEKVRKARHDLDEATLKPYFQLDRIIAAAFDTAQPPVRPELRASSHDVAALSSRTSAPGEVADADGEPVGLFLGDYFARPSKRSGAWMSALPRRRRSSPATSGRSSST